MDEEASNITANGAGLFEIVPILPACRRIDTVAPMLPYLLLPMGGKHLLSLRNPTYLFNDLGAIKHLPTNIKEAIVDILLKHDQGTYMDLVGDVGKSVSHLCSEFKLEIHNVYRWKNNLGMKEKGGPPRKVSKEVIRKVKESVKGLGLNAKELDQYIIAEQRKRSSSEASGGFVVDDSLSERTRRRYRKEVGSFLSPKELTESRVRAAEDLRNHYSLYVLLQAFGKGAKPIGQN